jgi:hypothetical protein
MTSTSRNPIAERDVDLREDIDRERRPFEDAAIVAPTRKCPDHSGDTGRPDFLAHLQERPFSARIKDIAFCFSPD